MPEKYKGKVVSRCYKNNKEIFAERSFYGLSFQPRDYPVEAWLFDWVQEAGLFKRKDTRYSKTALGRLSDHLVDCPEEAGLFFLHTLKPELMKAIQQIVDEKVNSFPRTFDVKMVKSLLIESGLGTSTGDDSPSLTESGTLAVAASREVRTPPP